MPRISFMEDLKSPGPMGYWGADAIEPREGDPELYDAFLDVEHVDDRTPAEILEHMMAQLATDAAVHDR
ncbi:MAG: hypothetical protein JWN82_68 [Candidatus Saccharibacteria bacterium]|nr:hypothetical protein [Candidatus Saccharibacteria bacterium]